MSSYKKVCVTVVLTDGATLPLCVILNLKSLPKEQLPTAVFLKLGCVKRCQGIQDAKMPNGRRVLLVVPNLYVWIKIQLVTFNTYHSITDSMQTIHCCLNPEASWFQRYPFTYNLPEDYGLNSHAFWSLSKASTHKWNYAFYLWTTGNPCSPQTDSIPCICHMPTDTYHFRF